MSTSLDNRRKRILYQATHRGMKETDRIVGGFVTENVADLSELELSHLDALLQQPDADILNWIYDRAVPPRDVNKAFFEMIKNFNKNL